MRRYEERYPFICNHFGFHSFNKMQEQCIPNLLNQRGNFVVSAPTATGKTVLFELAILKEFQSKNDIRVVYLAPIKSLCQQKTYEWQNTFKKKNLKVAQMTGDIIDQESSDALSSNIIVATPEKLDAVTRKLFTKINLDLLLIDQIHMLNVEDRGATLQAVVTRLMITNRQMRIVAASATIPNIQDVGRWLKAQNHMVKAFGEEYRPVRVDRHVHSYPDAKNPYIFQRMLNQKLPEMIQKYSDQKPSLVFCQTQSGTIEACHALISRLSIQYFVTNDKQMMALTSKSKKLSVQELKTLVPCGIAYHNASLIPQDRRIIEQLFLQGHLKVICTTSTLSMGVNLPARLVIIKSTNCYRGAGRGYEQYTKAQIEQMIGRAGRPQFETQGTAVIMTTYSNSQRYNGPVKLEQLESQLLPQLKQHINSQIALRTVKDISDIMNFIKNTFLYIRINICPTIYNIRTKENIDNVLEQQCIETVTDLDKYGIISHSQNKVVPLEISMELSKSYITVETVKKIIDRMTQCTNLRTYLLTICLANELRKFRSKLDERRCLKSLNEQNCYQLKETIGTSDKKAFVLLQAHLSRLDIQDWEMRRQASEICYFLRNLSYLARKIYASKKHFYGLLFSNLMIKFLTAGFWPHDEQALITQLPGLQNKKQLLKSCNVRTKQQLSLAIANKQLGTFCREDDNFVESISNMLGNFESGSIIVRKDGEYLQIEVVDLPIFNNQLKNVLLLVGDSSNTQHTSRIIRMTENQKIIVRLKGNSCPYHIALVKEGIIGFDQIWRIERNGSVVMCQIMEEGGEKQQRKHVSLDGVKQKRKSKKPKLSLEISEKVGETCRSQTPNPNRRSLSITKNQYGQPTNQKKTLLSKIKSRKMAPDQDTAESSNINQLFDKPTEEKPTRPIESFLQKFNHFESKYSTDKLRRRLQLDKMETQMSEESTKCPPNIRFSQRIFEPVDTLGPSQPTQTPIPHLTITKDRKSAYDYFRSLMQ